MSLIGVTIASEGFETMAIEAMKRFRKHTGIEKCLLVTNEGEGNYADKLGLYKLIQPDQTFIYFDADLWFIRDCKLDFMHDRLEFIGCHDPGCNKKYAINHFPYKDSQTFGIKIDEYVNGGLFAFNYRHIKPFQFAEKIMSEMSVRGGRRFIDGKRLHDFGEQTSINYAMSKFNIPIDIIPSTYNFMPFACIHVGADPILKPIAIHAAGYGADAQFPDESAGEMKTRALLGYEYKYKSGRRDFYELDN